MCIEKTLKKIKNSKKLTDNSLVVELLNIQQLYDIDMDTHLYKGDNVCIILSPIDNLIKLEFKPISKKKEEKQAERLDRLIDTFNKQKSKQVFNKKVNATALILGQIIIDWRVLKESSYFEIKAGELTLNIEY